MWDETFDTVRARHPGLAPDGLARELGSLFRPFTEAERREMVDRLVVYARYLPSRAEERSRGWRMPTGALPEAYLSLLRWANGCEAMNGERFIRFLEVAKGIRRRVVEHVFPEFLPGVLPVGTEFGPGVFCFDLSTGTGGNDRPVVMYSVACMDANFRTPVAPTFLDFCRGRSFPEPSWAG